MTPPVITHGRRRRPVAVRARGCRARPRRPKATGPSIPLFDGTRRKAAGLRRAPVARAGPVLRQRRRTAASVQAGAGVVVRPPGAGRRGPLIPRAVVVAPVVGALPPAREVAPIPTPLPFTGAAPCSVADGPEKVRGLAAPAVQAAVERRVTRAAPPLATGRAGASGGQMVVGLAP